MFLAVSTGWAQDFTTVAKCDDGSPIASGSVLKASRSIGSIPMTLRAGDVNGDGQVSISDVTQLIGSLLSGSAVSTGADVDGDGEVGIADVTELLNALLTGSMPYTAAIAQKSLDDIYYSMRAAMWTVTNHQSFGISAYNLMAELMGDDMLMKYSAYGWFWSDARYNVKEAFNSLNSRSVDLWLAYYTWIADANYLIEASQDMTGTTAEKNYVLGQAYAIRAYSYFMLAQTFARTYKGHESDPCVPIYEGLSFGGSTGQPRSTVAQVYSQIDADITQATTLLDGTTQQNPSHMGYAVAMGLKSRVALVKENWSAALTAGRSAINTSEKSIQEVSDFMGVNDVTAGNVMWGVDIPEEESTMFASFFSHMGLSHQAYGQFSPKQITPWLYDKMSSTDARRAWWDPTSEFCSGGYAQLKFDFVDATSWAGDYIWMRVEEMYLNVAEAACRLNLTSMAKDYLGVLMAKRDPSYTCNKTGTELGTLTTDETGSLLEEILIQRRLELWGEDGRIYTIRRLRQGFERPTDGGWPSQLASGHAWNDPECYAWVLTIPYIEFDGNSNVNLTSDQNPLGDYPETMASGPQNVTFTQATQTGVTADASMKVTVPIRRATTSGTYYAVVNVTRADEYSENVTADSRVVTFADGVDEASITITFSRMELGNSYTAEVSLSDADIANSDPSLGATITSTQIVVSCMNVNPEGQNISFETAELNYEVNEGGSEYIPIRLTRARATDSYSAQILFSGDDEHLRLMYPRAVFSAGASTYIDYIHVSNLEQGHTYTCVLTLSDDDIATADPNAGEQITTLVVTITCSDWEFLGTGRYETLWSDSGYSNVTIDQKGTSNKYRMRNFLGEGYNIEFTITSDNKVYISDQPCFTLEAYGLVNMYGYANSDNSGYAGTYDPNTKVANLTIRYYCEAGYFPVQEERLTMP